MNAARTPLVCGNWKLHKTIAESLELATAIKNAVGPVRDVEVAIAPSFTALHAVGKRLEGSPVKLAAQNCHWEDKGAFTGEVAPPQLADVGCHYGIIGHSERRQLFGELDAGVALKLRALAKHKIVPIVCIGETLTERDAGEALARVGAQLDAAVADLDLAIARTLVLAYEPVWAIGTGRVTSPAQAEEVHHFLRGRLDARFGANATGIRILYGGSVKPDNAALLLQQPNVDGFLVGGASLVADDFLRIVRYRTGNS